VADQDPLQSVKRFLYARLEGLRQLWNFGVTSVYEVGKMSVRKEDAVDL